MTDLTHVDYVIPQVERLVAQLVDLKCRRLLIEAPLGLKNIAIKLAQYLRARLDNVYISISGRSCWGLCDVSLPQLLCDYWDCIVHLGHILTPNVEQVIRENVPEFEVAHQDGVYTTYRARDKHVVAVPVYRNVEQDVIERIVNVCERIASDRNCIILYSQQYEKVARAVAHRLKVDTYAITGCYIPRLGERRVVVISSGFFHAITPILYGVQDVVSIDVEQCRENTDDVLRRVNYLFRLKLSVLLNVDKCRTCAILVSEKVGQRRVKVSHQFAAKLQNRFEHVELVEVNEITQETLRNLPFDLYVNTACPRLGFDDLDRLNANILNINEVEVALRGKIEEYNFKLILH